MGPGVDGLPTGAGLWARVLRRRTVGDWAAARVAVGTRRARLGAGWLHRYHALCGTTADPVHPCAPYAWVTPMHLAVVGHRDFPLPAVGLVHVHEDLAVLGPLHPDQRVDVEAVACAFRETRAGIAFDLHTTLVDAHSGDVVWRSITTALRKHPTTVRHPVSPTHEAVDRARCGPVWDVPGDMGRRYGRVARNLDPIHATALGARMMGFPGAIVHGMYTLGRVVTAMAPAGPCRVQARFRKPVVLPARIALASEGPRWTVWPAEASGGPHGMGRVDVL